MVYGPRARLIHSYDEAVDLDSVRRVTQTLALFVARWCGLEPV
jgi:acetylornithine deacetylase